MGIFSFLGGGNPADKLKAQVQEVNSIVKKAATTSGPASNPAREQLVKQWLGNFARNLEAATTALATGRDMRMQPIVPKQVAAGLTRMCEEFGQPKLLQRLGDVCDSGIQKRFQAVINNVKKIAGEI